MKLGYNTNGFAHHPLPDAIDIIGKLGYESIAITLDYHALNPWDDDIDSQISMVRKKLNHHHLSCVIETGARFLLDKWKKHKPTLISKNRERSAIRMRFMKKAIHLGARLETEAVSFWSGTPDPDTPREIALEYLAESCRELAEYGADRGVVLGFEPEPGMLIENLDHYSQLKKRVDHDNFKLTLDLGHAFITESPPLPLCIETFKKDIVNIHLEDMKKTEHRHLFFGKGDMDFPAIVEALKAIDYSGPVNIELSNHSSTAVETASKAMTFMKKLI